MSVVFVHKHIVWSTDVHVSNCLGQTPSCSQPRTNPACIIDTESLLLWPSLWGPDGGANEKPCISQMASQDLTENRFVFLFFFSARPACVKETRRGENEEPAKWNQTVAAIIMA